MCSTAVGSAVAALGIATLGVEALTLFGVAPTTARLVSHDVLILGPLVTILAVGAVAGAASQAVGRYWVPAAAVALQQLIVLVFVSLHLPLAEASQLPLGFTVGALGYLAFQVLFWPWGKLPMALSWTALPDLAVVVRAALPLLVGAFAVQVALLGLRVLASQLTVGAVTAFDLAYRLVVAIVEVSASGVLAVVLTEWSGAVASGRVGTLASRLRDTIALVLFVTVPVPVIAHALRSPLIHLWLSTTGGAPVLPSLTITAVAILLAAVPLEISGRLYTRVLLAQGRTRIQGWLYALRMVVTVCLAVLLVGPLGLRGLALSEVAAVAITLVGLHRAATARWTLDRGSAWTSPLAGAGAAAAAWCVANLVGGLEAMSSLWLKCLAGSAAGGVTYVLVARLLKSPELQAIVDLIRSRQALGLDRTLNPGS
jgi:peptidoglycan biosynthesis protein MviN/MurJ (putative lipid II flippase)